MQTATVQTENQVSSSAAVVTARSYGLDSQPSQFSAFFLSGISAQARG